MENEYVKNEIDKFMKTVKDHGVVLTESQEFYFRMGIIQGIHIGSTLLLHATENCEDIMKENTNKEI